MDLEEGTGICFVVFVLVFFVFFVFCFFVWRRVARRYWSWHDSDF